MAINNLYGVWRRKKHILWQFRGTWEYAVAVHTCICAHCTRESARARQAKCNKSSASSEIYIQYTYLLHHYYYCYWPPIHYVLYTACTMARTLYAPHHSPQTRKQKQRNISILYECGRLPPKSRRPFSQYLISVFDSAAPLIAHNL